MERKKFTFVVHMLSCISVTSINASSFKHVLLLALSCNELNYSLITTLEKGCVQILIAGTCSPPSQSASSACLMRQRGGTLNSESCSFPQQLSQGHFALQCRTHPWESKGQTRRVPRGINATCATQLCGEEQGKVYLDMQ